MENTTRTRRRTALTATGVAESATPCLVTFNSTPGGPTATAKAGRLVFLLNQTTNTVDFDVPQCTVTGQDGKAPKNLVIQPQTISFDANSSNTYTMALLYRTFPPAQSALARFQENCSGANGGIDIDENTGPASYKIQVI